VSRLLQATDGNFYGTTTAGGIGGVSDCSGIGCGTVFRLSATGTLTTLYNFCSQANCADGSQPTAGLIQATDGNLYGTTSLGGLGFGTVFKITRMGTLTTLYSFDATHGANPYSELTQAANGDLYGTTAVGTSSGTVFRITREGRITTVYRFCLHQKAQCPDGKYPYGAVVEGSDGYFYGTTLLGGANNFGTVFKVNPQGTLTTLYSFDGSDGEPGSTLAEGSDGNFYGTTYNALIFEISPGGALIKLHTFDGTNPGPRGGLLQATNGKFYGQPWVAEQVEIAAREVAVPFTVSMLGSGLS
jgi:uncharacterized repeat protein (TIGR03803 family)